MGFANFNAKTPNRGPASGLGTPAMRALSTTLSRPFGVTWRRQSDGAVAGIHSSGAQKAQSTSTIGIGPSDDAVVCS